MKTYNLLIPKVCFLTLLTLAITNIASFAQDDRDDEERYQLIYEDDQGQGEYIQNTRYEGSDAWGIGFYASYGLKVSVHNNSFYSYVPITASKGLTVSQGASITGNTTITGNLTLSGTGDIFSLDLLQGTDDLRFRGSANRTENDLYITADGLIGIGTNTPNSKLHVIGANNNGSTATLSISSGDKMMLLDGNQIDATNGPLFLQNNAHGDVVILNGKSGNVGIGKSPVDARLHIKGDFRIDSGSIKSWGALAFKPDIDATGDDAITFYNSLEDEVFKIDTYGNIGIGTTDSIANKLEVIGTVKANSFVTSTASFPDYVFEAGYNRPSLSQVKNFVTVNKHLPNMPAEKEVVQNGLDVPYVLVKSVENIENLYLYMIEMSERLDQLEKENEALKALLDQ